MSDNGTILKLVPSLRARKSPDGSIGLTEKFIDGVKEFEKFWQGPLDVYVQCSDKPSDNLDERYIFPDQLKARVQVLSLPEIANAIVADRAAVVLLSLDDFRQSSLGAACRRSGIACAYISEYSLTTRKQIIDVDRINWLRRMRRKWWEANEERKRREAVEAATGLQCNGTPTYDSYRAICPEALLYFDTRITADLLATQEEIRRRLLRPNYPRPLRLLFSGRLIPAKGAGDLVALARELRKRKIDFRLDICGDGELKAKMSDEIRSHQLSEQVTLKGVLEFKEQLVPFVKSNADLFVCCHPQGDPSCTYLETMSCGVPIAGYTNEAFEGVVRHSGCGWVVPENTPSALADKIAEIQKAPDSLLTMSLAALAFAKEHTFEQTFSRRVRHLRTLEGRNAQAGQKTNGLVAKA
jgi:colanic acid/amylovoran biosynthesis glycosyltransferase